MRISCLLIFLLISNYASGLTLYDVTFSSPVDQLNQPASVGEGQSTPTANVFGTSRISGDVAGHDRSMLFVPNTQRSTYSYSQYQFDLGINGSANYLRTQFDVFVGSLAPQGSGIYNPGMDDGFSLLFDTPLTVRLDFTGAGQILNSQGEALGLFSMGLWISMVIDVDLTQNMWTIYENGAEITHSQFYTPIPFLPVPPSAVSSVRMNVADNQSNPGTPQVYVNNILIETGNVPFAPVPEASPGVLLLGVGAFICFAKFTWSRRGSTSG